MKNWFVKLTGFVIFLAGISPLDMNHTILGALGVFLVFISDKPDPQTEEEHHG